MTQTIVRLYATVTDADAAVEDLRAHGFTPEEVFVVQPPMTSGASPSDHQALTDEIVDRIAQGYILKGHAVEYAKKVAEGCVLVAAYAPFGSGFKATVLLDRHKPVESGVPAKAGPHAKYDEATPLSSALRLPVLSSSPTPFGAVSGLPSVLRPDGAVLSAWLRYSMVFEFACTVIEAVWFAGLDGQRGADIVGLGVAGLDGQGSADVVGLAGHYNERGADVVGPAAPDGQGRADIAGVAAVVVSSWRSGPLFATETIEDSDRVHRTSGLPVRCDRMAAAICCGKPGTRVNVIASPPRR